MATTLPRITARVDVDTQNLLNKAATLAGMSSVNSFVVSAAVEKAKQIIERDQILKLSRNDAKMLIEALDRPAFVNTKLKSAVKRYEIRTKL
jgi:uncharacterized protein (DUF1778 family)